MATHYEAKVECANPECKQIFCSGCHFEACPGCNGKHVVAYVAPVLAKPAKKRRK